MKKDIELENKIRNKILLDGTIVPNEWVDLLIDDIFKMCPQELELNVWEWIEDKPYTNIKYKGLSINDLISLGYDKKQFLRLIDTLNQININFEERYKETMIKINYYSSTYRC